MFPYSNSSSWITQEGAYSFPFFQFPCPFMDDLDDGLLGLSQQNHSNLGTALQNNPLSDERISGAGNMMMSSVNGDGDGVGKKRRYEEVPWKKKDRHSKICTAQGLRDRRMRLSVKVARKFFDLQDMLDFDKASKTIEWLLINSEPAIQQLHKKHFSAVAAADKSMSSSNSEVVSESNIKEIESLAKKKARPPIRIAKESRDKARARARDRTRHKLKLKLRGSQTDYLKTSKQAPNKDSGCGANGFLGFTGNVNEATMEPAYAMTSKKASLGNGPNAQEHSSILMTISNGGPWNPSSLFWTTPNAQDPIPNSTFMNTNALELGTPSPLFTASNSNSNNIGGTHFL